MTGAWLWLCVAIMTEVAATICLRLGNDAPKYYLGSAVGYIAAFTCLALALARGMPLGVGYGVWSATGVALTAILGRILFKDPLTGLMGIGIAFIMGGILMINFA